MIKYSVQIWGFTDRTMFLTIEGLELELWRAMRDLSSKNLSGFRHFTLWLNSTSLIHHRQAFPNNTSLSIKSLSSLKLFTRWRRNLYPKVRSVLYAFSSLMRQEILSLRQVSSMQCPLRITWYTAIITLPSLSEISLMLLGMRMPAWRFFPFRVQDLDQYSWVTLTQRKEITSLKILRTWVWKAIQGIYSMKVVRQFRLNTFTRGLALAELWIRQEISFLRICLTLYLYSSVLFAFLSWSMYVLTQVAKYFITRTLRSVLNFSVSSMNWMSTEKYESLRGREEAILSMNPVILKITISSIIPNSPSNSCLSKLYPPYFCCSLFLNSNNVWELEVKKLKTLLPVREQLSSALKQQKELLHSQQFFSSSLKARMRRNQRMVSLFLLKYVMSYLLISSARRNRTLGSTFTRDLETPWASTQLAFTSFTIQMKNSSFSSEVKWGKIRFRSRESYLVSLSSLSPLTMRQILVVMSLMNLIFTFGLGQAMMSLKYTSNILRMNSFCFRLSMIFLQFRASPMSTFSRAIYSIWGSECLSRISMIISVQDVSWLMASSLKTFTPFFRIVSLMQVMYFSNPSLSLCLIPNRITSTLVSHPWAFFTFSQISLCSYQNMLQYFKDTMSTLFSFKSIYWVRRKKLLLVARGRRSLGLGAWTSWLWRVCWLGISTSSILRIPKRIYSRLVNVLGIYKVAAKLLANVAKEFKCGFRSSLDLVRFCRDSVMNASTSFSSTLQIFSSLITFSMIIELIFTISFFQSICQLLCPPMIYLLSVAKSFSTLCLSPELHFSQKILHFSGSARMSWMACRRWLKNSERELGSARIRNWLIVLKSSSPDLILETVSSSLALARRCLRSLGQSRGFRDLLVVLFLRSCCSIRNQRWQNIEKRVRIIQQGFI